MQTFLFSPILEEPASIPVDVAHGITEVFKTSPPMNEGMLSLFNIMKKVFPCDHILVTYATEYREEEQYFLFPMPPGMKLVPFNTFPEQLAVLRNNPSKVIRLGDHSDHGVTLGLIGRLFPGAKFSALIMRAILSHSLICSVSMVQLGKGEGWTDRHVAMAFSIFDDLFEYCRKQARPGRKRKGTQDRRWLPLTELPGMRQVNQMLWYVARQDCPILLLGESGTGKEVVAETLYRASARVDAPFVKVNCGGLPDSLIDSELFGHEKGAFTGAVQTRKGFFERADRGMLLLDEIGELPLLAQTRLLRVLQEGVLERVGGSAEQRIDIRIIAATHRDLSRMVQEGRFRADLYFRLNVFPIIIPPLRERPEDIPVLVRFLIEQKCRRYWVRELPEPSERNIRELMAYPWPGNIRELNNAVERAVILWVGNMSKPLAIRTSEHFMPALPIPVPHSTAPHSPAMPEPCPNGKLETLDEAVARHIRRALEHTHGKISGPGGAAELLDLHPNTLRAKMHKLGILACPPSPLAEEGHPLRSHRLTRRQNAQHTTNRTSHGSPKSLTVRPEQAKLR